MSDQAVARRTEEGRRQAARALVASFAGMAGFPSSKEGIVILVNAMLEYPSDLDHARRVADSIRQESRYAPTEYDIRRAALATREERPPPACEACSSTGWRVVEIEADGRTIEAVERCRCRQ